MLIVTCSSNGDLSGFFVMYKYWKVKICDHSALPLFYLISFRHFLLHIRLLRHFCYTSDYSVTFCYTSDYSVTFSYTSDYSVTFCYMSDYSAGNPFFWNAFQGLIKNLSSLKQLFKKGKNATVHTLLCMLYCTYFTVHTLLCILYCVHFTVHTLLCILWKKLKEENMKIMLLFSFLIHLSVDFSKSFQNSSYGMHSGLPLIALVLIHELDVFLSTVETGIMLIL